MEPGEMPCVAVLGERIVDLVPDASTGAVVASPGGSPANVAVALARLGVRPVLLGRAGDDEYAEVLDEHLRAAGLDLTSLLRRGGPSMVAECTRQPDGSMSYDFRTRGVPDLAWTAAELAGALDGLVGCAAWHTGSLVSWLEPSANVLLDAWRRCRASGDLLLSYDPNVRTGIGDPDAVRAHVDAFARAAHVVKASDEDLALCFPDRDPDEIAESWLADGVALVVVTRGAEGASAWTRAHGRIDVAGRPVEVADTVGAGDTCTAAVLAGLVAALGPGDPERVSRLAEADVRAILERAVVAASLTCTRPGADPPTAAEVDRSFGTFFGRNRPESGRKGPKNG